MINKAGITALMSLFGWAVPDNLSFVPVDFTKDSLAEWLIVVGR